MEPNELNKRWTELTIKDVTLQREMNNLVKLAMSEGYCMEDGEWVKKD